MILLAGKQFCSYSPAELANSNCLAVDHGTQALAHLISGECGCLVLGQELSLLGPMDVLELWRSIDSQLPVVLVWGSNDPAHLRQGVRLGISDFLVGAPDLSIVCSTAAALHTTKSSADLDEDLLAHTPRLLTLFRSVMARLPQQTTGAQQRSAAQALRNALLQRLDRAYPWLTDYVPCTAVPESPWELETQLCSQLEILHRLFPAAASPAFRKILRYILTHMDQEPHQPEIAAAFYLSTSALSQLFTRELGCGFRSYVAECRMLRAASLLAALPPQQVAKQLGYQDYSYFTKQFRKRFGSFPAEYQSHIGKERRSCTQPIE